MDFKKILEESRAAEAAKNEVAQPNQEQANDQAQTQEGQENKPTEQKPTDQAADTANAQPNGDGNNQPQETQQPTLESLLKEKYGDVKLEEVEKFVGLTKENPFFFDEYGKLKEQVEKIKLEGEKNPYANDYVKQINDLVSKGKGLDDIKTYIDLSTTNLDEADPKELKVKRLMLEKGWSREDAEFKVSDDYKIDKSLYKFDPDDEDEVADVERQIEREKKRLKLSVGDDKEFLQQFQKEFTKVENNQPTKEQIQAEKDYKDKIEEYSPLVVKNFQFSEYNLNGKQGDEAITFRPNLTDEERGELTQQLKLVLNNAKIPFTKEGLEQMKPMLENIAWTNPKIRERNILAITNHAMSTVRESMAKEYSGQKPNTDTPVGGSERSGTEKLVANWRWH